MLSTHYSCYLLFKIFHVSYVVLTRKTFFQILCVNLPKSMVWILPESLTFSIVWKDTILIVENQKSLSLKINLLQIKARTYFFAVSYFASHYTNSSITIFCIILFLYLLVYITFVTYIFSCKVVMWLQSWRSMMSWIPMTSNGLSN